MFSSNFIFQFKLFFIFLVFFGLAGAQDSLAKLDVSIKRFCGQIYDLMPPVSMLLVIAAAATYAAGQLTSAETRARATGWATAMVVGALFGFVLLAIIPQLIIALYSEGATNWRAYCDPNAT